jgi:hypothetical protein
VIWDLELWERGEGSLARVTVCHLEEVDYVVRREEGRSTTLHERDSV